MTYARVVGCSTGKLIKLQIYHNGVAPPCLARPAGRTPGHDFDTLPTHFPRGYDELGGDGGDGGGGEKAVTLSASLPREAFIIWSEHGANM